MKAMVKTTDEIINVYRVLNDDDGTFFYSGIEPDDRTWKAHEIELLSDTPEIVIEGWVLRDDNNKIGIYREKPTCDEDGYWDLTGEKYDLFPDITPDMLPKKYRITITLME